MVIDQLVGTPSQGTGMKLSTTIPTCSKNYRHQVNYEIFS